MGRLPAEVRALTPAETTILIHAWNEANAGDDALPSDIGDTYDELVEKYG